MHTHMHAWIHACMHIFSYMPDTDIQTDSHTCPPENRYTHVISVFIDFCIPDNFSISANQEM